MSIRVVELVAAGLVLAAIAGGQSTPTDRADLNKQREYWNDKFRSGLPNVRREPSRVLVDALSEHTLRPGSALDLGCGEGRNLLYLTERGWTVTGVDLSEVAVGQAKQAVASKKLKANFVVAGLDEFDLGENQWDLITSIYMQDWHLKSRTNTFLRMRKALKPGGLVIIEGFGPPNGLNLDTVRREFDGFLIVRAEVAAGDPDWGKGRGNRRILRFVARKKPALPR